ncbi:3-keto-5-aminohexanoate cleavage protein [Roseibium sp.]|uniref:3-keto-5-aminohexanoate cleavage protein n=1 Tax=Roseibium sp. TaxID=1936156 RepID=UPI003A96C612
MTSSAPLPSLPRIMVAPNGARKMKSDHPALPITVEETVRAAKACFEAGAEGLHAHVRDRQGNHVLDAGLYRELLKEMGSAIPGMHVQITTEAVGIYSPEEQRALVRDVMPNAVSIALREMCPDEETAEARSFYHWAAEAGIAVQHILYSPEDVDRFLCFASDGVIPGQSAQVLFVLGRYAENQESDPEDLDSFLTELARCPADLNLDWAICAFGHRETDCLVHAMKKGGKARIGFENGLWNRDGALATDNADRVHDLVMALKGAA